MSAKEEEIKARALKALTNNAHWYLWNRETRVVKYKAAFGVFVEDMKTRYQVAKDYCKG